MKKTLFVITVFGLSLPAFAQADKIVKTAVKASKATANPLSAELLITRASSKISTREANSILANSVSLGLQKPRRQATIMWYASYPFRTGLGEFILPVKTVNNNTYLIFKARIKEEMSEISTLLRDPASFSAEHTKGAIKEINTVIEKMEEAYPDDLFIAAVKKDWENVKKQHPVKEKRITKELLQDYVNKNPQADQGVIAEHFGISRAYLSTLMGQYGIKYVKKGGAPVVANPTKATLQQFIKTNPAADWQKIAAHFKLGLTRTRRLIREYEIPYVKKESDYALLPVSREKIVEYIEAHPEAVKAEIASALNLRIEVLNDLLKEYEIPYELKKPGKVTPAALQKYIDENPFADQDEIAAHFGVTVSAVSSMILRNGLNYEDKRAIIYKAVPKHRLEEYIDKHPKATLEDLAAHFQVSISSISILIKEYNVPYQKKNTKELNAIELQDFIDKNPDAILEEIALVFEVNVATLKDKMAEYGTEYTPKSLGGAPYKEITKEELEEYIKSNPTESLVAIGEYFGVSSSTIRRRIEEFGIEYEAQPPGRNEFPERVEVDPVELQTFVDMNPGLSRRAIGVFFGVSEYVIISKMEQYGTRYNKKARSGRGVVSPADFNTGTLTAYIKENPAASIANIAEHFGVSQYTVYTKIKKEGIPYQKKSKGRASASSAGSVK